MNFHCLPSTQPDISAYLGRFEFQSGCPAELDSLRVSTFGLTRSLCDEAAKMLDCLRGHRCCNRVFLIPNHLLGPSKDLGTRAKTTLSVPCLMANFDPHSISSPHDSEGLLFAYGTDHHKNHLECWGMKLEPFPRNHWLLLHFSFFSNNITRRCSHFLNVNNRSCLTIFSLI